MGEAKRRAKLREAANAFSKPLKRARFNLYAIGTRRSTVPYVSEEISWWTTQDERLIGMVALDYTDRDYLWMILARDRNGRFRCANLQTDFTTPRHAEEALRVALADALQNGDVEAYGVQGDETNAPIDLLRLPTDCDPETLHPYFRAILEDPGRAPARAVIKEIGPWLAPSDPHLVNEFQHKGFDQRLWELYLWAALKEFSLDVELLEAPDFHCTGPGVDFTIEATTAAPSEKGALAEHPNPKTDEEREEFNKNYMPMKYGSALVGKLNKTDKQGLHYWEHDESKNKPFVLAIADFHKPADKDELGSMTYTQTALWQYLYGDRVHWEFEDDQLIIKPEKIGQHQYGEKIVPSGFFDLPSAENISAVIFSNAGTISKFDRMGVVAGFGAEKHTYLRMGVKYKPDPNSVIGETFALDVSSDDYEEYWTQEIQVFHNPNARHPLSFDALPGAIHHRYDGGLIKSLTPNDAILNSFTVILKEKE
jgi:hypothetical protein